MASHPDQGFAVPELNLLSTRQTISLHTGSWDTSQGVLFSRLIRQTRTRMNNSIILNTTPEKESHENC
jgi:hypothetical protein